MYSEMIETIVAAINLLYNCGEGNNEITTDLEDVKLNLEAIFEQELMEESNESEDE